MVDLDVITTVLRKFGGPPRSPKYLDKPEYAHLIERNKEIYLSSAYYKHHWSWQRAQAYYKAMLDGKKYFICSLPYQVSIMSGLLSKGQIFDEMSENDFDPVAFSMEMDALFYGESEKAFFKIKEIQDCRISKKAIYPPTNMEFVSNKKRTHLVNKQPNEIRLLGIDIALMADTTHKNDNTIFTFMRLLPQGNQYIRQVLYMESMNGENTENVAIRIKQLFYDLECDYCVLDTSGSGIGIYDSLGKVLFDIDRDIEYPTWTALNDDETSKMQRSNDPNALPIIFSIKASASLNHAMAVGLKTCFENKKIKLLVNELDAREYLIEQRDFLKKTVEEQNALLYPYIQISLLVNELVNLEGEVKSGFIKITETGSRRKDRYSSISYTNHFANVLEKDLITYNDNEDLDDYLIV